MAVWLAIRSPEITPAESWLKSSHQDDHPQSASARLIARSALSGIRTRSCVWVLNETNR
jgi:hypothetical protein